MFGYTHKGTDFALETIGIHFIFISINIYALFCQQSMKQLLFEGENWSITH